ncbi:RNA polymerase sigma factor [Pollutimonas bauzanensis]|uniref:RNA polymerase sigma factor, sigma-70 family n=1 Tax=Pollutimonas bauzanensis TaxID=658167 RepID=A0A1M5Z689_9BURK|nr:sigma-70 family RNA polymerase sigma factor [Pollutimonas bauzanensis]SHI19777.1 RNA polymerase sigma factor, sigma-70 family [Pollutimonas bauzanensis]
MHARNFLYRAAQHRAIDMWRRESRYQHIAWDDVPEDAHPVACGADAGASAEQLREALVAALEKLPLNCRRAFVLNRIEGWTQVDIARHLKLSPGSVERYIARATQHVRERVRDDD